MGISRYNSEGYADPTAYEAIRSIETFRVDHPNGYIEVNLETFFPCTNTKAKKLFRLVRDNCSEAQQEELLDKVLEDMDNTELTDQLKAIAEEKQAILGQLGAIQQDEEQRAGQEARLMELAKWLNQQKSEFTEYDDTITRKYVERITVVDAETIRIKFRYTDIEIDRAIRK